MIKTKTSVNDAIAGFIVCADYSVTAVQAGTYNGVITRQPMPPNRIKPTGVFMSRHYPLVSLLSIASVILVTGCERYAVTLNERPIYTPKAIYSGYSIPDSGLASCVKLALTEAKVSQPEQLEVLNCSFAGITDLSGIELFSQLKTVNLNSNQLTDIKALLFLGELRQVNLSENPAINCTDIEALEELLENATIAAPACNKPL